VEHGDDDDVRAANVLSTGKSGKSGKWVYCQSGTNERIYFVEPPRGWGPETAYNIG
jgi:hypothetical protein